MDFRRKTILRRPVAEPHLAALPAHLHPVIRRILAARAVASEAELDYSLKHLLPYRNLKGIEQAAALLHEGLEAGWRMLVVADYDADGATSCAVAVRGLRLMGAKEVHYLVPDRFKHGYGLTPLISQLAAEFRPDLLITVDNGISSLSGVATAKELGMRVLITDHHLPGAELPPADAIVNPNQPGDVFPSKTLAGVGVMFYLLTALRARLREAGWFAARGLAEPNLGRLLDLVALGTVADVVPLDYNNRILVEQGLRRIRQGECAPGVAALIRIAAREQPRLVATDFGFQLGPRLNAAGRMDNMAYGIDCLLSDDPADAFSRAEQLDLYNQERRVVEAEMQAAALEIIKNMALERETALPFGLCLYDPEWHEGVVGLVASRIKDRLYRPVIVFTAVQDSEDEIKGSARSVPGLHIRDALDSIAARHPGLIVKFGGHSMAAGLTIARSGLAQFREAFDTEVRRHLQADALRGVVHSDGSLAPTDFTLEFAEQLRTLTPWGQGFPEPIFDGRFILLERRLLKERHLKMTVQHPDGGNPLEAIAFNTHDRYWPAETQEVTLAFRLDVNEFRGFRNLQLLAEYVEPA